MQLREPALADGCGSSRLDVVTHVLYDAGDDPELNFDAIDMLASMARTRHEFSHWVRFHGSSTGHLLNLLRHTRDATAAGALRNAGPNVARTLRIKRRSGVPLWSIEQPDDPLAAGEGFAISGQAWSDSYWLWNMLFDSSSVGRVRSYPEESAPFGLADAWLYSEDAFGNANYPGNDVARSWLKGPIFACATAQGPLTTRLMWGCASTVDELMPPELWDFDSHLPANEPLMGDYLSRDSHQKLAHIKLRETPYGLPARLAVERGGAVSVIAFLLLIDFALNPPLPMLGHASEYVSWAEFYPPERFLRCVEHGQALMTLTSDWQEEVEHLVGVYELLSELTGLPYFSPAPCPWN